jgi:hypothetical protein
MAGKDAHDHQEKDGLSSRMHDLLRLATVEDRREPESRERSGPQGERRRRTDQATQEKRAELDETAA